MASRYLNKILRSGVGSNLSKQDKSEQSNEPILSTYQLRENIFQSHLLSSMPEWKNDNDFESSYYMDFNDQHREKEASDLSAHTIDIKKNNRQVNEDKLDLQKVKDNVDVQKPHEEVIQPKENDINVNQKKSNKDGIKDQKIEDRFDFRELLLKNSQSKNKDRIPIIEIIQQPVPGIPATKQPDSQTLDLQLKVSKLQLKESDDKDAQSEGKKHNLKHKLGESPKPQTLLTNDIEKQKIVINKVKPLKPEKKLKHKSSKRMLDSFFQLNSEKLKTRIIEPKEKKIITTPDTINEQKEGNVGRSTKPIEMVPRQADHQHLKFSGYDESIKKTESKITALEQGILVLNRKLEDHISKEGKKPIQPNFLPKRPPSVNLGGWSDLERRHVR